MTDDELIAAFKSVAGKGEESPFFEAVAQWLRDLLNTLPPHKKIGTIDLAKLAGFDAVSLSDKPEANTLDGAREARAAAKRFSQVLWQLRRSNLMHDCWEHDPTKRYMGRPLILWHKPIIKPDMF